MTCVPAFPTPMPDSFSFTIGLAIQQGIGGWLGLNIVLGWLALCFSFLWASITGSFVISIALQIVAMGLLLFTAGFIVPYASIPIYLRWLYWGSFYSYSFSALMDRESGSPAYQQPLSSCAPSPICPATSAGQIARELFQIGDTGLQFYEEVLVLVGYSFGLLCISGFVLWLRLR